MKVLSQLLGIYSDHNKPFILFRLPDTDILLYRLSDIQPLFNIPKFQFKKATYKNCYRDHEDTYLDTKVLSDLAHQFKSPLLAELCKLKPNDYPMGLADDILQTFSQFTRAPKEEHIWESVQLPLENMQHVMEREEERAVKAEPTSPLTVHETHSAFENPMAIDKVLSNNHESRKPTLLESPNKRQRVSHTNNNEKEKRPHSLSSVAIANNGLPLSRQIRKLHSYPTTSTVETEEPSPQSPTMDKKKMSNKHKNSLNLTIFAPSYHEQLAGVRSAPIKSNFNQHAPSQQVQQQSRSNYVHHGHAVSSHAHAPASATVGRPPFTHQASPRRHEFAIPPIVPSQQQPPHTAHPSSRENISYQQYIASPSLYGGHHPSKPHPTTSTHLRSHESQQLAVNAASVPLPPKTPTTNSFAALQRQQYLQPFEHLFDTIETTRTLKSTLDDQIRRSSSLMQTLQASATTLEGLVRNQVKEAQWEVISHMEQKLEGLTRRIEKIENKINPDRHSPPKRPKHPEYQPSLPSPLPSATREERAAAEDLVAFSEKKRDASDTVEELQTPPTIVRSQNDIGPQEYHNMLNTLRDRLDRLERQIET